jgi:hypothetical protein
MARHLCCEEGCTKPVHAKGRCRPHYAKGRYVPVTIDCPWCGPTPSFGSSGICPSCDMTPGEHAYRLRILADSDAVYAEENRAFQAQRQKGGS